MAGAESVPADWRSRAWYQIQRLASHLGRDDLEIARRERMFTAIDRFSHPTHREREFMKLELCTRTEADLLEPMLQAEHVRTHILPPEEAPAEAKEAKANATATATATPGSGGGAQVVDPSEAWAGGAATPAAAPDPRFVFKPVGRKKRKKSMGPQKLYKQATAAWSTYQAHEMKGTVDARLKAKDAARIVRDVVTQLAKLPEGQSQLEALLSVIGLDETAIVQSELEKRIR